MAYNIYFDSEQISPNYIYELSKEQNLFADEFKLGGTPMAQYKMVIDKNAIETLPSLVQIRNGTSLEETLRLDNAESEDELTITLTLVDYMFKFEFTFDASPIVPCTLLRVLQEICTQAGVTLATTTFTGSDKNINWYDSTITAREYISYIAELAGGYACMNASGELQIIPFNNTAVDTIQIADCENFKLGEQHVITRVVYDTGTGIKWEYGTTTGDTYYVDVNNVYITDESDIEAIYNVLNGYEYYSLSVDNCPINTAKIGETIAFTDGTNTYKTIAQIDQTLAGDSWFGGYTLDVKSSTQAETIVRDAKTMIKTIKTEIDREVGELSTTVEEVQETVEDVQGDVDELGDSLDGVNTQITTINNNVSNITQTTQSIQTQVTQTQTTLENDYATKEQLSSSVSSLSSTIEQTASGINVTISNVQSTVDAQGSQITTLETYIGATSRGLEIGRNTDDVKAVLGNNELAFYDKGNTKLAWLNSDEGLGATGLSIGNATTANQRWRVFTRQNGSHLTFTRHS